MAPLNVPELAPVVWSSVLSSAKLPLAAARAAPGAASQPPWGRLPVAARGQRMELGQLSRRCIRQDGQARGGHGGTSPARRPRAARLPRPAAHLRVADDRRGSESARAGRGARAQRPVRQTRPNTRVETLGPLVSRIDPRGRGGAGSALKSERVLTGAG